MLSHYMTDTHLVLVHPSEIEKVSLFIAPLRPAVERFAARHAVSPKSDWVHRVMMDAVRLFDAWEARR